MNDTKPGDPPAGPERITDVEPSPVEDSESVEPATTESVDTSATSPSEPLSEPDERSEAPQAPPDATTTRRFSWLGLIAFVLAAAALTSVGWILWSQQRADAGRTASADALAELTDGLSRIERQLAEQRSERARLDQALTRVEARQRSESVGREDLELRVTALERSLVESRGDALSLQRAEAEHLLRLANQSLTLAADIDASGAALKAADAKLRELADPALTGVRELIAVELQALAATAVPDIEGLALRLASLASSVNRWPIEQPTETKAKATADEEAPQGLNRALQVVGQAFDSLISVRRVDTDITPLLLPEEEFFLRRNLELQLQTARLALLNRDQVNFRESLRTAEAWLAGYFDTSDSGVVAALDSLEAMQGELIRPTLPDISGSLALLTGLSTVARDGDT